MQIVRPKLGLRVLRQKQGRTSELSPDRPGRGEEACIGDVSVSNPLLPSCAISSTPT